MKTIEEETHYNMSNLVKVYITRIEDLEKEFSGLTIFENLLFTKIYQ
jgi:hypothetical protein